MLSKLKKYFKTILKNTVFANLLLVSALTLGVKGLGFLKEVVIADSFGLSELLDTFLIAFMVPSFISTVFLGAFRAVFVPNYVAELKQNKDIGAFQSTSFIVTISASIFFVIVAVLFTDVYLETLFKGHTESYYALIKLQFYYVLPCILIWGVSSLVNGLLTIDNEFTFTSIGPVFTSVSMIVCLLFFKEELGNLVLAVGTLFGSILGFLMILYIALRRKIIQLKKPDFKSRNIKILFKQIPAKITAGLLVGINPIVDQYFSAQLVAGSIAALGFGIKIPAFAIGIIGIATGKVLLPYFSKLAIDDIDRTFKILNRILKNIMIGGTIVVVILFLLSNPIIRLIFERNEFTSADTLIVAKIQQMYLLQVPFYISSLIMVRFLIAINKNSFMAFASLISLILNIILNYYLIQFMGVNGLALSTSLVAIVNGIVLYLYILKLKLKGWESMQ